MSDKMEDEDDKPVSSCMEDINAEEEEDDSPVFKTESSDNFFSTKF